MTLQFKATETGCEDDGYALLCGASNAKSGDDYHYITIQGCSDPDDEDDDGVHFEIDDQINGNYDLLRSCRVNRSQIRVELHRDVLWHPGLEAVEVDCSECSQPEFDALVAGLRRLFHDRPADLTLDLPWLWLKATRGRTKRWYHHSPWPAAAALRGSGSWQTVEDFSAAFFPVKIKMNFPDCSSFKIYFYGRFGLNNHWQAFVPVVRYLNTLKANQRFHLLFMVLQDVHQYPYEFQKVAAGLMMKVDAGCPLEVSEAVMPILNTLDLSVQEFPLFLARRHGKDHVMKELRSIDAARLDKPQRTRLDTLIYWTHGFTDARYEELRRRWSARIKC